MKKIQNVIDNVGQIIYSSSDRNEIGINTFAVLHFDLDELRNYARKNNMFMMYKMDYDNYYWCLFKDFRKLSDSDKYYAVMHATDPDENNMFSDAQRKAVYFFYNTRQRARYKFPWNKIDDMEYLSDWIELYDAFYAKSTAKSLPCEQEKPSRGNSGKIIINGKEYSIVKSLPRKKKKPRGNPETIIINEKEYPISYQI